MKRLNMFKGMYALLVVVTTMIGITIYASCSADDDYDNYSSGNELFTLADGEMSLRSDVGGGNGTVLFQGDSIDSAGIVNKLCQPFNNNAYHANLTFQWTEGWTGNISQNQSQMYASATSIHFSGTEANAPYLLYNENNYTFAMYNFTVSVDGAWKPDLKYHINLVFYGNIYRVIYNNLVYVNYGHKTFYDIQQYDYDDLGIHIYQ